MLRGCEKKTFHALKVTQERAGIKTLNNSHGMKREKVLFYI
jgi:hypothetical protein